MRHTSQLVRDAVINSYGSTSPILCGYFKIVCMYTPALVFCTLGLLQYVMRSNISSSGAWSETPVTSEKQRRKPNWALPSTDLIFVARERSFVFNAVVSYAARSTLTQVVYARRSQASLLMPAAVQLKASSSSVVMYTWLHSFNF